ncbi:DUF1990 domain-containing protein [Streptosporangiaceae bacterium NEAU-GS5]|nr:DUF1990 domain-containing protein [Streptosporangiaceae bacterium NEAU-GS5]
MAKADLTYERPGATRDGTLPAGYDHLDREVPIGHGREAFERAAEGLLGWEMHRGAGLKVVAGAGRAAPDVVVILRPGVGPLRMTVPCRVVYVVDTDDRQGFAYGTLPGHPERGEEAFVVRMTGDGDVLLHIRAFSRPATLMARAGGPLTRLTQRYITDRCIQSLRRLAQ